MVDVVNKELPFRIHSSEKLTELRQGCSNLEALRKEPAALSRRIVQRWLTITQFFGLKPGNAIKKKINISIWFINLKDTGRSTQNIEIVER